METPSHLNNILYPCPSIIKFAENICGLMQNHEKFVP